jgi:hypothetical protein
MKVTSRIQLDIVRIANPTKGNSRWLRREPSNNPRTISNILQPNIIIRIVILASLLLSLSFTTLLLFALSSTNNNHTLGVRLLDIPKPATQVLHEILLDERVRNAIFADCLPYCGVGVGECVADNVGAEGEVCVKFEEVWFDLFEVERFEGLRPLLPFGDLRVHISGGYGARFGAVVGLECVQSLGWEKAVVG